MALLTAWPIIELCNRYAHAMDHGDPRGVDCYLDT